MVKNFSKTPGVDEGPLQTTTDRPTIPTTMDEGPLQTTTDKPTITKTMPQCLTTDEGPRKSVECALPWRFNGKLREGCITETDPDGRYSSFFNLNQMQLTGHIFCYF